MARQRSPDRDKAKEMYLDSKGKLKLKDIAEQLGVKDSQIRKWKSEDKWEEELKGTLSNSKSNVTNEDKEVNSNVTNKKGAPKGNKNAIGNHGGPPPGNKNAVTTGEFETIFFDTLEDDEKELIKKIEIDKRKLIEQEIHLLTVRERRMLKRINDLKSKDFTIVSYKSGIEKGQDTDLKESQATLCQIQSIEEALTRVQDKKAKLVSELHKWEVEEQRLELDVIKLELEIMKRGNQDEEVEDDGFYRCS